MMCLISCRVLKDARVELDAIKNIEKVRIIFVYTYGTKLVHVRRVGKGLVRASLV